MQNKIDGLLDNWSPCRGPGDVTFVVGNISGDRKGRFRDGTLMGTSMLTTSGENLAEGMIVETLNSRYQLGKRATQVPLATFLYAASLAAYVIGPDNHPIKSINLKTPTLH